MNAVNAGAVAVYQPFTTDASEDGMRRARNAMRERLWADNAFAHRWLCHPGHSCEDGCDGSAGTDDFAARVALYQSDIES